jgi:lysophospholipase L1-like esterase
MILRAGVCAGILAVVVVECGTSQSSEGTAPDASFSDGNRGSDDGRADSADGAASSERDGESLEDGGGVTPGVRFVGRMDTTTPTEPSFEWEGCGIEASFRGTQVSMTMRGDATAPNYFAVFVDGTEQPTLVVNGAAATSYPLATGLSAGTHHVLVFRRAESFQNATQFVSFDFGTGGDLLAPPAALTRRIEFIGDSITAGYGVECTNANTGFTAATENEYLAYGSITARDLNAEAHVIAWSGEGVYRNYGSDPADGGPLMPDYWLRTLPTLPTSTWDFSQWTPDAVVVNLGTNDFSTTPPADIDAQYQSHYLAFIQRIHTTYPSAHIFCALGPMLGDPQLSEARTAINAVIGAMQDGGLRTIELVEFPAQDCGANGDGCGCDYHPNKATQQGMATQLETAMSAAMGW